LVNVPAAYRRGPLPSSCTTKSFTSSFIPEPRGVQELPSQRATRFAGLPSAVVNRPPAKSAGPAPSSNVASAKTQPEVPAGPPNVGSQLGSQPSCSTSRSGPAVTGSVDGGHGTSALATAFPDPAPTAEIRTAVAPAGIVARSR